MHNKLKRRTNLSQACAGVSHSALRTPRSVKIVSLLLAWFSANARHLPWRCTRDPYAIWVSESMLQQTQVKTVIPYWERWMRDLPTIQAAAKASPARLNKLWEGLGYYTRVRNLQKAAQQIATQSAGQFPESFDGILALPGIGRYTAGAIASIAFNQPRPILDGNVIRVLTRVFGIAADPREKQTNAQLWQFAGELVTHAANPGSSRGQRRTGAHSEIRKGRRLRPSATAAAGSCSALNQSLMELGALVCTPRSPNCAACPVQKLCRARKNNSQEKLPHLGRREAVTARRFIAFVVERSGKFLVRQRPGGGVNAHLWEFPNVEIMAAKAGGRPSAGLRAPAVELRRARRDAPYQTTDFRFASAQPLCTIKHSITRYRITLEAWRTEVTDSGRKLPGRWLPLKQLHKLAFTSAHKKILAQVSAMHPAPAADWT